MTNFLRAMASFLFAGLIAVAAWLGYQVYDQDADRDRRIQEQQAQLLERDERIKQQQQEIEAKIKEIERIQTAMRLLKVDRRVAQVKLLKQETGPNGKLYSTFEFVELDPDATDPNGHPISEPRQFTIEGDMVHIDAWTAKFEDKYVEEADPLRAASICLFRRVYGDAQEPQNGYPLDNVGERPRAYGKGQDMSEFERKIWTNFWEYANDPEKQKAEGIRGNHGEVVYIKLMKGRVYKILLRSSGGMTFVPEVVPPKPGEAS